MEQCKHLEEALQKSKMEGTDLKSALAITQADLAKDKGTLETTTQVCMKPPPGIKPRTQDEITLSPQPTRKQFGRRVVPSDTRYLLEICWLNT